MKKKLAIMLCVLLLLTVVLVGCIKLPQAEEVIKDYAMDLDVGINKSSNSSDWNISCNATTTIKYKYIGDKTDSVSLQMNSATFIDKTPIDKASFDAGYPVGARYGKVEIQSATVNDKECASALKGNELKLKLAKDIRNGSDLEITVKYYLELPRCNMRYGYNNYTANFAQFYPQVMRLEDYSAMGDSFYSTADNYAVNIKYPSQYKCVASGSQSASQSGNGITSATFEAKSIRDFAFFIGLSGNVKSKTEGGVTVSYMYCTDNNAEARLDVALSAIKVFSEKFGRYDKSHFSIVSTPFAHGGMEYGDIITVDSSISNNTIFNNVVVHEIAHQWWYGMVGSDQTNHAWQDEGLTEFSVYYYHLLTAQDCAAHDDYAQQAENGIRAYRDKFRRLELPIDENMDRQLSDFLTSDEYIYCVYEKGFIMFKTIYEYMGDKLFMSALQDYFNTYKEKLASPQDLFTTFDKYHVGISGVFKVWLRGNVINS